MRQPPSAGRARVDLADGQLDDVSGDDLGSNFIRVDRTGQRHVACIR